MPQPRFLPPSGYDPVNARQRVRSIVRALSRSYPGARTSLHYEGPFQLVVATILSAQSTDEMVNKVTPVLFERYPSPQALAEADPSDVERIIHPTGFFRQKTRSIIGCARKITEDFSGEVPRTVDELVTLPGVARKTANVVVSNLWPHSGHGIFVDTHIRRTSQRLALTDQEDPVKIEQDLMRLLPRSAWVDVPHQLILLGRGPCEARKPRHEDCPLLRWCPTGQGALAGHPRPSSARRGAGAKRGGRATEAPARRSGGGSGRGRPRST